MKIKKAVNSSCVFVETDEPENNVYRFTPPVTWEVCMGESWEAVYDTDELCDALRKFRATQRRRNPTTNKESNPNQGE